MQNLDSESILEVPEKTTPTLGWCVTCMNYEKCLKIYNKNPEKYDSNLDCLKVK